MSHPRSIARAAVRAALEGSGDLTGVTVFRSWQQAMSSDALPAIGVITPRETSDGLTGDEMSRTMTLVVAYRDEGGDDLEDSLDDVSAVIEPLVLNVLSGSELYGLDSTDIEISGEGERPTGLLTLTFSATRYAPEGLPA